LKVAIIIMAERIFNGMGQSGPPLAPIVAECRCPELASPAIAEAVTEDSEREGSFSTDLHPSLPVEE
jgi:hypothetical protein